MTQEIQNISGILHQAILEKYLPTIAKASPTQLGLLREFLKVPLLMLSLQEKNKILPPLALVESVFGKELLTIIKAGNKDLLLALIRMVNKQLQQKLKNSEKFY